MKTTSQLSDDRNIKQNAMPNNLKSYINENKLGSILLLLVIFQYSNFYRVAIRCIYEGGEFQWMETWGVSIVGKEKAMRIMGNGS